MQGVVESRKRESPEDPEDAADKEKLREEQQMRRERLERLEREMAAQLPEDTLGEERRGKSKQKSNVGSRED